MRRYLVVAHQTLTSQELLEALRARASREDTAFHLLVPLYQGESGMTWTEGHVRAVATRRLDEALMHLTAAGLTVDGEVGTGDSPITSVEVVLRREGPATFAGVIVSTLPRTISKWLKLDVPSRVQRLTTLPVEHVIGHPADVNA
jgi:hypothetical protein